MCSMPSSAAMRHISSDVSQDLEPSSTFGRMWQWISITWTFEGRVVS